MPSPLGCFEFKLSPAGSPALACHPFGGGGPFCFSLMLKCRQSKSAKSLAVGLK